LFSLHRRYSSPWSPSACTPLSPKKHQNPKNKSALKLPEWRNTLTSLPVSIIIIENVVFLILFVNGPFKIWTDEITSIVFKNNFYFLLLQQLWPTPLRSTHTLTLLTHTRTRTRPPHTQQPLTPLTRATLTLTMTASTGQENTKLRLTTQPTSLSTRFTTIEHAFPTTPFKSSGNKRSF